MFSYNSLFSLYDSSTKHESLSLAQLMWFIEVTWLCQISKQWIRKWNVCQLYVFDLYIQPYKNILLEFVYFLNCWFLSIITIIRVPFIIDTHPALSIVCFWGRDVWINCHFFSKSIFIHSSPIDVVLIHPASQDTFDQNLYSLTLFHITRVFSILKTHTEKLWYYTRRKLRLSEKTILWSISIFPVQSCFLPGNWYLSLTLMVSIHHFAKRIRVRKKPQQKSISIGNHAKM